MMLARRLWQSGRVPALTEFNELPPDAATEQLRPACASSAWLAAMVGARPYADLAALSAASHDRIAALTWPDLEEALAAHPMIGATVTGADTESGWSRGEQAGAATASEQTAHALRLGNLSYQRRFGHVFLVCATGLSATEMLARLHERLHNDAETEREVVRSELDRIVDLRLTKTFGGAQ